ncbi:MAG: hypothetical protein HQK77_17890, partial [Desulfobacterales bacterium]|nr:hypothetical protein [Desulfobacterales bacterium]
MKKQIRLMINGIAILILLLCHQRSFAGWSDGQNAEYVIGQANFTLSDPLTSQNGLKGSHGVAIDVTNGKLYVADQGNHRVLRYAYPITTNQPTADYVFGQADFISGSANRDGLVGSVAANTLFNPMALAVMNGDLWVVDKDNNRVLKFASAHSKTGPTYGAAADVVLGQSLMTTNSTGTTQSTLHGPLDICSDSSGRLWVADGTNHRVLRFDDAANKISGASANGVLGQTDFTSLTSGTSPSKMNIPGAVGVSGTTLWVGEWNNNRVLRFDTAASKANGANADGVLGQADFISGSENRGLPAAAANSIKWVGGLAADSLGRLYVSDAGNKRVLIFNDASSKTNGANADNVLGQSNFTSSGGATSQNGNKGPNRIAIDSTNQKLMVSDSANHRILQYRASANGLNFDGTNDIIDVGDVSVFNSVTQYTVEAWVKFDTFANWGTVFAKRTGDGDRPVMLQCYGTSGQLGVAVNSGYGRTSTSLSTNTWYHIAIVYDGAQATDVTRLKLYIDGTLQVFLTLGTVPASTPATTGSRFVVGAEYDSTSAVSGTSGVGAPFDGTLDELRVWSVARSQSDIQTYKNVQLTGSEENLSIYYNFNQGTESGSNAGITTLTDTAGTAQNGTLCNFALTGSTSNWMTGYVPAPPGAATHLKITGTGTQIAGTPQTITITAYDGNNNVAISYSESKDLIFSGASVSPNPATSPTCSDINFGNATPVNFVDGVGTCTMKLYKAEPSAISIDVSDGTINSTGSTSYDLDVSVSVGTSNKLLWVTQPPTSVVVGS